MSEALVVNWSDLPKERPQEGLDRCAVATDQTMVVHNVVAADMAPWPHEHPFEQIALFTRGRGTLTIDDTPYPVAAGSVAIIPANTRHSLQALGDEPLENIDVFVPVRGDYRHLLAWMDDRAQRSRT